MSHHHRPLAPRARRPRGAETARKPWTVLALALVAQVLVVLDISVVNTALPTIGRSLDLESSDMQWMVTAYLLMSGGGLLLGGRIADLLPRRRIFMTGMLVFTAASLASGFASSAGRAHRGSRRPGRRRRADDAGRAVADHDHLPGRPASPRPRALGSHRRSRHRRRCRRGRRPHHLGRLAGHLLGQRARSASSPSSWRRTSCRAQPAAARSFAQFDVARRGHRRDRPRRADVRHLRHRDPRLDLGPDRRRAGRRRRPAHRLRPRRAPLRAAAGPPAHLVDQAPGRRHRRHARRHRACSSARCSSARSSCRRCWATPRSRPDWASCRWPPRWSSAPTSRPTSALTSPPGSSPVSVSSSPAGGALLLSRATSDASYAVDLLPGLVVARSRRRHGVRRGVRLRHGRHPRRARRHGLGLHDDRPRGRRRPRRGRPLDDRHLGRRAHHGRRGSGRLQPRCTRRCRDRRGLRRLRRRPHAGDAVAAADTCTCTEPTRRRRACALAGDRSQRSSASSPAQLRWG